MYDRQVVFKVLFFWPTSTSNDVCDVCFANFATCSWELLTMLNPHFVAGIHRLFEGHESEDIRTIYFLPACCKAGLGLVCKKF